MDAKRRPSFRAAALVGWPVDFFAEDPPPVKIEARARRKGRCPADTLQGCASQESIGGAGRKGGRQHRACVRGGQMYLPACRMRPNPSLSACCRTARPPDPRRAEAGGVFAIGAAGTVLGKEIERKQIL